MERNDEPEVLTDEGLAIVVQNHPEVMEPRPEPEQEPVGFIRFDARTFAERSLQFISLHRKGVLQVGLSGLSAGFTAGALAFSHRH